MRILLPALVLIIGLASWTYMGDDDYIAWKSSKQLSWSDFEGRAKRNRAEDATTTSSINFAYSTDGRNSVQFTLFAAFHPKESWVKKDSKSAYLLHHEQQHFNITEWFVRKLRKRVKEYPFDRRQINRQYEDLFNEVHRELQRAQNKYDRESNHSRDRSAQKQWDRKIQEALDYYSKHRELKITRRFR